MARQTKETVEKTRKLILQSALDLFYEKGYTKTTFDAIATRINLTKGAVYWHFKNKSDIIATILKENILYYIQKNYSEPKTLDDVIENFYNAALDIQKDENQRKFIFFMHYQMEWSEEIYKIIMPQIKEICDIPLKNLKSTFKNFQKQKLISSSINSDIVAETIYCLWHGLLNKFIVGDDKFDFAKLSKQTISLVLNNLNK